MGPYSNNIELFKEEYKNKMGDPQIINKELFLRYCQERSLDLIFQVCSNIELQLAKLNANFEILNKNSNTVK